MTWVWIELDRTFAADPAVPLTQNLAAETQDLGPAFDRRIQATFPVGSSEEAMGLILGRQGFTRRDWTTRPDEEHSASREEHHFPCVRHYQVLWHSDPQGRLLSIRGQGGAGCL